MVLRIMTQKCLSKRNCLAKGIVSLATVAMVVLAVVVASDVQSVGTVQTIGQGDSLPPVGSDSMEPGHPGWEASVARAEVAGSGSGMALLYLPPIGSDPMEPGHPGWGGIRGSGCGR
jgi:hypothetical protein